MHYDNKVTAGRLIFIISRCVFVAQVSSLIAPFVIVIHDDNANIIYTILFLFCIMGRCRLM